mmetsp:Transcript_13504/g.13706  ORF Transcript_13504/g.13706 Transcript_13504/m.13706 type:complete len:279 (+) Transcript_13504:410-1246(+)
MGCGKALARSRGGGACEEVTGVAMSPLRGSIQYVSGISSLSSSPPAVGLGTVMRQVNRWCPRNRQRGNVRTNSATQYPATPLSNPFSTFLLTDQHFNARKSFSINESKPAPAKKQSLRFTSGLGAEISIIGTRIVGSAVAVRCCWDRSWVNRVSVFWVRRRPLIWGPTREPIPLPVPSGKNANLGSGITVKSSPPSLDRSASRAATTELITEHRVPSPPVGTTSPYPSSTMRRVTTWLSSSVRVTNTCSLPIISRAVWITAGVTHLAFRFRRIAILFS